MLGCREGGREDRRMSFMLACNMQVMFLFVIAFGMRADVSIFMLGLAGRFFHGELEGKRAILLHESRFLNSPWFLSSMCFFFGKEHRADIRTLS
jgi:hypothetical protein